jgi:hypothetical protein
MARTVPLPPLLLLLCAAQRAAGLAGAGRALLAAAPAVVFTPEDVRAINALDMAFFGLADSPECEMWKVRRPGGGGAAAVSAAPPLRAAFSAGRTADPLHPPIRAPLSPPQDPSPEMLDDYAQCFTEWSAASTTCPPVCQSDTAAERRCDTAFQPLFYEFQKGAAAAVAAGTPLGARALAYLQANEDIFARIAARDATDVAATIAADPGAWAADLEAVTVTTLNGIRLCKVCSAYTPENW